jgi:mono/diheme cytochrome c family protein
MRLFLALLTALLAALVLTSPARADDAALAARVKEIFRGHCLECHGGAKTNGGVKILDHALLLEKEKLVPKKPDESAVFVLPSATDDTVMPPQGRPKLPPEDIDAIRKWILAGAPAFPPDADKPAEVIKGEAGTEYVLKKIHAYVREARPDERRFLRFFSINHLLVAGATADELELHREALAKTINHLSWEGRIARPKPIDSTANTVFALDLRDVGWQLTPFSDSEGRKFLDVNLFDLALLEYPYGIVSTDSEIFDRVTEEYLMPASLVRPIPFVRADWFVSAVLQPVLYEDFLQLPFTLAELEAKLEVDSAANMRSSTARRAGMTVSGVSRNNRVVERHASRLGAYWKSFDFRSSRGPENMFKDPLNFREAGGEMIFNLPNGLQGYFVADANGNRLEVAPTDIVVDKFADDRIVRNGLSCIRCHDSGMKGFTDTVRPALLKAAAVPGFDKVAALRLYAEQKEMDGYLKEDGQRFMSAMQKVLGKPQQREPLIPVTRRFLENPLTLAQAAAELGLSDARPLTGVFRLPQFSALGLLPLETGGVVRRDAWEEYYDQAVRGLGLGVPVVPLDGLFRRDYPSGTPPFEVELRTNKKSNVFEPGDHLVISVTNKSPRPLNIELVGTSAKGKKVILTPAKQTVAAGETYRFPPDGTGIAIRSGLGKEQITLLASDEPLPAGILLRGKNVTDRVVHLHQRLRNKDGRVVVIGDTGRVVKKTLEIETR